MINRQSQPDGPYRGNLPGDDGFTGFRSDMEREYPTIQVHDFDSPDVRAASRIAEECIHVSGAEINLYHRTDNEDVDHVWDSDPDPTYWAPIVMKAFAPPKTIELALKSWGVDAKVTLEMHFALGELVRRFGTRIVRPGDVIGVPYNAIGNILPMNFRVVNATPFGNYRYVWMYLQCNLESLTGDLTVQPRDEGAQIADYHQ